MATDPTRSIRRSDHPSTFDIPADQLLAGLAQLPPQREVPYLTVTLDWSVAGDNPGRRSADESRRSEPDEEETSINRPALRELEKSLKALLEEHGPHGDLFDALQQSTDRIESWLQSDLDPAASGVYIVAHEPTGVFEATGLNLPVETGINLAPTPRLYDLMRLVEDHPTYAVLQADQESATLSFVTHGARDRSVRLESSEYPRKQASGGWNQKRYQKRADERVDAFARDTIEQAQKELRSTGVDILILAASDVMASALTNAMPDNLTDILVDTVRMESVVTDQENLEQTLPVAEEAERKAEQESVDRLKNAVGEGSLGAAGADESIRALQNGQADTLVMNDTFQGDGWADYEMHVFGVDNLPTNHPVGGEVANLVPIELREELVRLAFISDAKVDIIHSSTPVEETGDVRDVDDKMPMTSAARDLEELGGVGVILRYALSGDAEPETI